MKKLLNPKRLLKKRNNGGFTLLEVIVSCALLGILVVGVMTFVSPIFNMLRINEKNARATLLSETLDSYIAGSLKNAKMVEVFTNTTRDHAKTDGMEGTTGLQNINQFMEANHSDFEVRCIGINWFVDGASPVSGRKKLVLTNCEVDKNYSTGYTNNLVITKETKVFDDTLYDGLYPIVTIETFASQDSAGNDKSTNASGYKITADIYGDPRCYSVISDAARGNSYLSFKGATYVQCVNMTAPASNIIELNSTQAAIDSGRSGNEYTENGESYYYPDTYIYYVVPK